MTRPLHVLKFGGSSLVRPEPLRCALEIVREERARGPIALVVSALGDTTDELVEAVAAAARGDFAAALSNVDRVEELAIKTVTDALGPTAAAASLRDRVATAIAPLRGIFAAADREAVGSAKGRDEILSFGERVSAVVVAGALEAAGVSARAVDARTWAVTDDRFGDATVLWGPTSQRLTELTREWTDADTQGVVHVHTGFIGATSDGRTTTLGRNGSDYTAALLARGLGAGEVTIFTDVSGVMTADPDLVDEAYPVPHLSYGEALELAGLGLRMLHPRTMVPLIESGIPMRIRNTLRPEDPGTLVDAHGSRDTAKPTCITSLEGMALIDVEGSQRSEFAKIGARVGSALAAENVPVWFETQAPRGNGIALAVAAADAEKASAIIGRTLEPEIAHGDLAAPRVFVPITLVTLVAEAMGQTPNVVGRFFGALGAIGVNVRASSQGATSRAIVCAVDAEETAVAVRAVHAAFNLAREQVNVLLLGKGTVGGSLLQQMAGEREKLREQHDVELRLAGLADSRTAIFDTNGIDPARARDLLDGGARLDIDALLDRLKRLPVPVLVDCTAADGMEAVYERAFARGIHVVAANKKPLALPLDERRRLFESVRRAHRAYRYETTVGASLPVIETLKNLVRTGDRVLLVEGSLSGTLGYLSNEVSRGVPLSQAVRAARELGYTEPHPRDDLGGVDAARKALILARELGVKLDLSDVQVGPFVPSELLEHDDVDAFFAALERYDATFQARVDGLRAEGRVLRYLARIEPGGTDGPSVSVGPVGVPANHPATRLRGSEAFVAFTTERYSEYPLVVQGAGAGGAVTAAGVLADVLALSQSLRGR